MPRFVLLHHDCPEDRPRPTHWDLMLEATGVLRTWVLAEPLGDVPLELEVERLADHRLAYLELAGPVSGGRGSVSRVAAGEYEVVADGADGGEYRLASDALRGVLRLVPGAGSVWRLTWTPESFEPLMNADGRR